MMGGGFGIPGLGMVLVWVLIIGALVLLVRAFAGSAPSGGNSARHLLDERFARGAIDREEYEVIPMSDAIASDADRWKLIRFFRTL